MKTIAQPKTNRAKRQSKNADGRMPSLLVPAAGPKTTGAVDSLAPHARLALRAARSAAQSVSPLAKRFGSTARSAPQRTVGAFNPALPEDGALVLADVLRDQFNGLNDEIQTRVEQSVFDTAMAGVSAEMAQHPTTQQMDSALFSAIQNTAVNPMNISPLYITISDPPTQSEVQQMLYRMNELISALYRAP